VEWQLNQAGLRRFAQHTGKVEQTAALVFGVQAGLQQISCFVGQDIAGHTTNVACQSDCRQSDLQEERNLDANVGNVQRRDALSAVLNALAGFAEIYYQPDQQDVAGCCATDPTAVADAFANMNVDWMLHTLHFRFIAGSWRAGHRRDYLLIAVLRSGSFTKQST
jgi:hypothetical protein